MVKFYIWLAKICQNAISECNRTKRKSFSLKIALLYSIYLRSYHFFLALYGPNFCRSIIKSLYYANKEQKNVFEPVFWY